jgi:circadian clock protein KaiC
MARRLGTNPAPGFPKAPTGIAGLDTITAGGLPRGRPTLVAGGPGCGKTLFGMEFLVRGAREYDEPGVFVSFEESAPDLAKNVRSLGFDLAALQAAGGLAIDHVYVERSEIEETGDYDLEGLFIRLGHAIDSVGAKRVVLDTLEVLFSGLSNTAILRAELRRLFRWLRERGVTAVITAERGDASLTRHGLEEYVSDCVILLDHRVNEQIPTRRLRVVKYRGSSHGTNEYPFLIGDRGLVVLPITALGLDHPAPTERVSTGLADLDAMFDGHGLYRGSCVLVSGTAGAGKTSFAATLANAACARGERVLYVATEESPAQILRNMGSIGLDLGRWSQRRLLHFQAMRASSRGLEMHLAELARLVDAVTPEAVVIDPITTLAQVGTPPEVKAALTRMIDLLKARSITTFLTSLTNVDHTSGEVSEAHISSLIDTWILLSNVQANAERNRALYVVKSRGMAHSNQIRAFRLTARGIELAPPPLEPGVQVEATRARRNDAGFARGAAR